MTTDEAFTAVSSLIALVTDAKACGKRLDELRKTIEQAEAAQAKLTADREEFSQRAAAKTAAADEREKRIRAREVAVGIAERDILAREKALADAKPPRYPHDPNIFGTLVREPSYG
jgi:hypothetical protein